MWTSVVPLDRPAGRPEQERMVAEGVVREFVTNPHGDVDGLLLDDGTVVRTPPHQGTLLQEIVHTDDTVTIEGRRHITPDGEVQLHADRIEAAGSGKVFSRDEPRKMHPAGPHRPPHDTEDVNARILRELREIRQLLENRG